MNDETLTKFRPKLKFRAHNDECLDLFLATNGFHRHFVYGPKNGSYQMDFYGFYRSPLFEKSCELIGEKILRNNISKPILLPISVIDQVFSDEISKYNSTLKSCICYKRLNPKTNFKDKNLILALNSINNFKLVDNYANKIKLLGGNICGVVSVVRPPNILPTISLSTNPEFWVTATKFDFV